jgi:hypothetical protein
VAFQFPFELVLSIVYLAAYAWALKIFTSVVFKKITVSKSYVTFTKKDFVLILIYFALFFNGFVLFFSSEIFARTLFIRIFDNLMRFVVAGCALGAAYTAVKADFFEEFA